jgi:hypothetical protein
VQIRTLRNIYQHLTPGGRFLLDLRLASMRDLVEGAGEGPGRWHTWTHPETGRPIRQQLVGRFDFNEQLVVDQCFIEYDGETESFPISGRWIFKPEFQLLLRLAGFERWEVFSTPERDPLEVGRDESLSYWIVYRS